MKKHLIKLLLLTVILTLPQISHTNAYFSSGLVINNNTFSTGCWTNPSIPVLNYPLNNSFSDSVWDNNPRMDWDNSTSSCPTAGTITYQYQSAYDPLFSSIAYQSEWLVNSFIPAPNTPDATYYWRVRAKDSFGNTSDFSNPWKFIVDRNQLLAPQNLHWTNPEIQCGGYTNSFNATATWNSVPGASSYMYEIDYPPITGGRAIWPNQVTNPWYTGAFNQAEGRHTFHVYAINGVGKTSPWSSSCSVTYDKTLPTSTITKPWNSDHDNDVNFPIIWLWDGKVEGTASDNFELDHVELSIYRQVLDLYWSGTAWVHGTESTIRVKADGTNNWSYQIDPMYIPLGKFKIVAHAVDKAGNIENSATIEFENSNIPQSNQNVTNNDFNISLSSNHSTHKINLKLDNITKPSDYEILYTGNGVEKGLVGKITADEITASKYSKDFYFGICSAGGTCVGDDVLVGSTITVNISGGHTLTKTFTY